MWETISPYILPVLGFVLTIGVVWAGVRKILTLLKEVVDLLNVFIVALADQKLTKEEIDSIIKEAKEIPAAIKDLLKK